MSGPPPGLPNFSPQLGAWSFWADTIVGAVPLGPVNPTAFTCNMPLSDFGSGSVTLPATMGGGITPDRALRLWSWRLWASYNGQLVWCGAPTGIKDTGEVGVSLTLTELPGYLGKRLLDVAAGVTYTQIEQTVIARAIAAPVSDVGVSIVTVPGPGFLRDRTYAYMEGPYRSDLMTNLAQVISGPEFRAEYAQVSGHPSCTLRIAYPRVGSGASGLGVQVPGLGVGYEATWDADLLRTRTFAVGDVADTAPAGTQKPVIIVDQPQSDLPRLDCSDDWPQVVLVSSVREHANAYASMYGAPTLNLTATATDSSPPLGSYAVGDDVTVSVASPLLSAGYNVTGRLTNIAADAAAATVTWTVAVTLPPPKTRRPLSSRLDAQDAKAKLMFQDNLAAGIS